MGFRTVVVENRAKLEYQLGYLVCRGEEEKKIYISEINTLILQSTAISITCVLLCELVKHNIKVIFCDEKCSPHAELLPYYGSYNNTKRIKMQLEWTQTTKERVWTRIVKQKIFGQATNLGVKGCTEEERMLLNYINEVMPNDSSNREGHAAKVYFNSIFGIGFTRQQDNFINKCLNYGYAILLSAFNREVVAAGYLTQLGIWHCNEFNDFNLSSDLMEPFRPFVDRVVLSMTENDENFKIKLIDILNKQVYIDDKNTTLDGAIKIYLRSVIDSLNFGDDSLIKFVQQFETAESESNGFL